MRHPRRRGPRQALSSVQPQLLEPLPAPFGVAPPRRFRVYVRASTDAQDESCDQQLIRAEGDLRALGLLGSDESLPRFHAPAAGVYLDDGVSAWQVPMSERPGAKALLDDLEQERQPEGQPGLLWVWAQSRLLRPKYGAAEAVEQLLVLRRFGWVVHSHTQGELDVAGQDGLAKTIAVALHGEKDAEQSREKSENVSRAKRLQILNGVWLGGEAPYGYERWAAEFTEATREGHRTFVRWIRALPVGEQNGIQDALTLLRPAKSAARLVADMFRLAADGEHGQVISINAMRERIEARTGKAWNRSTINIMLTNPAYAALQVDQRGALQPAVWEPLVDRVTWERVQQRLKTNASQRRGVNTEFSLSGLIACARCGGRMNGERMKRQAHLGGHWDYYRSSVPRRSAEPCPSCGQRIRSEAIEQAVIEAVARLADDPIVQRAVAAEQAAMRTGGSTATRRAALANRAAEVRQRITDMLTMVEQGGAVGRAASERVRALNEEAEEVEQELEALDHGTQNVRAFAAAAAAFREVWAHAAPAERKEALRCFVSRIEVDGERKQVRVAVLRLPGVRTRAEQ